MTFGGGGSFTTAGCDATDEEAPPSNRASRKEGAEEPPADEDGLASRHLSPLERPTWGRDKEGEESGSWEEGEDCGCTAGMVAVGP